LKVKIVEVGPRDGLQNESKSLSLEQKRKFVELLVEAGHRNVEVGAFVNPQKIPQMAGTADLVKILTSETRHTDEINFWSLVPNERGYQDAKNAGAREIAIFTAASETFNQKNINASIDGSFERFEAFVPQAKKEKMLVRGYVSTCFGCPYEGAVDSKIVYKVSERLLKLGVAEVSIGDTIGVATPTQVRKISKQLLKIVGPKRLAMHFHDTRGTALANILASLEEGVRIFDSSAGGLGGCPYAPGATGNVATEDLLYMLGGMGIETGVDLGRQIQASRYIQDAIGKKLPSRYLQAALSQIESAK